jgi:hypothetical protein
MKRIVIALAAGLITVSALAQEPVGCDKFKWPLDRERALLTDSDVKTVVSGGEFDPAIGVAKNIKLVALTNATLPQAPERAPKSASAHAGFVHVSAPKQAGTYKVTLSGPAWIDIIQDNRAVKSGAFSGALECPGIRKSVKFELVAAPFTIQLSGVPTDTIGMVITPAGD